ncbi:glycosyltransferase [Longimicrobium sp.]|uniref:glycosyltransferase n=1 Tax=Longimicrobium sp. TaxID=2029185 RepID=UPI002C5CA1D1|nr:glycosyltransferase [Longimicrobium sp.]HSU13296.1 glycosyltransferase [Longimicrobium sp.]
MTPTSVPASSRAGHAAQACDASVTFVVPVLNGLHFLRRTVPALLTEAERWGPAEVVFVDNGSTDGSYEFLLGVDPARARVIRFEGGTIGAVRNAGAREGTGACLAFVDADCVVAEGYLAAAVETLARTGAAATGCEASAPEGGRWIETAQYRLHHVGRDRAVHYINSGNFFITRAAFDEVGGFREDLPTGEDSEICRRMQEHGLGIWECTRVKAVHLGNPRTLRQFWRRTVWHGLGMFGTVGGPRLDRPTIMMAVHLALTVLGAFLLAWPGVPLAKAVAAALALQLAVPVATVAYRCVVARRTSAAGANLVLYWLYYWARLWALVLIVTGRGHRYRK